MFVIAFRVSMPFHLLLVFLSIWGSTLASDVPSHTCTVALLEFCGSRGRDTVPKRRRWDMRIQTCFPTGAQCQLSLHLAASWANWALSCTPKSCGIGLSQVTHSLVLTLLRNNKGDWWEASSCRNVSINEWNELRALNIIVELLCPHRISFKDYPKKDLGLVG